jgi:hypothetical protein
MKINCSKKQRGVVVVVVAIALPILLLVMGLALDFGHVFVNKTRLQNALDATALSAAIAINRDVNKDTGNAEKKGQETFNLFKKSSGNGELLSVDETKLTFKYSKTVHPWSDYSPTKADAFVFVRVTSIDKDTSTDMLNVTPWLIRILSQFNKKIAVPAFATAGPIGNNCNLTPFVICAQMTPSLDKNCNDDTIKIDALGHAVLGTDDINDCYGYNIGQIRSMVFTCKKADNKGNCQELDANLESGNFNLLDLDGSQGGKDIRDILQSTTNTCLQGDTLNTKPGWTWGNVQKGIDNRFDSDKNTEEYPPTSYTSTPHETYKMGNNPIENAKGSYYRREMSAPIGDCTGLQHGNSTIDRKGTACVFLTEHVIKAGSDKKVMIEFTGSCEQNGVWNPQNPVLNGPYKIVLFKSTGSGDS